MNALELNEETSLFKGVGDKVPTSVTIKEIYCLIIGDSLENYTEKYRYFISAGLIKDADKEKKKATCFTPSVVCKGGHAKKHVVRYTRHCMADFDDVPLEKISDAMAKLHNDPYVELAYITISNTGLRIIYRTDVTNMDDHSYAYAQGNEHFAQLLGLSADPQCKDATRCSIICKDTNAYFNPNSEVMHISVPSDKEKVKKKPGRPHKRHTATVDEVEQVIFHDLEKQGKEYVESHYNEYVSSALYLMNDYGVPEGAACQWAIRNFHDYDASAVTGICHSVYQHTDEHGCRPLPASTDSKNENSESFYASIEELEAFIDSQAIIRINLFNHRREIQMHDEEDFRPLTDMDENSLWLRAKKKGLHTSYRIFTSILNSEFISKYQPFQEYFEGLNEWDGLTDYIAQVSNLVETDEPGYFQEIFKKWFVACVASILNPEIINHEIMTFIGKEGIYKTTFFSKLLPKCLRIYFCTKINLGAFHKDELLDISDFMLTCLEEIDSMSAERMNQIKASVTLPEIGIRAPYAHNREYRPHNTSFCATGNNLYFLPDGDNRRWLPVHVLSINGSQLDSLPYEGMYAQAIALYHSGFRYWFNGDEIKEITAHNDKFKEPNIEEDLILDHFRLPLPGETPKLLSVAHIMQIIGLGLKYPLSRGKIRQALDKLRFRQARKKNIRGFLLMELTQEEKSNRQTYNSAKDNENNLNLRF